MKSNHLLRGFARAAVVGVFLVVAGCGGVDGPPAHDYASSFGDAGTTRYVCSGTATPCASLDLAVCADAVGSCRLSGSCGGTATPCASLNTSGACSAQSGCYWDANYSLCTGTASGCGTKPFDNCTATAGCYWANGSCSGTIQDCPNIPYGSSCMTQVGCTWAPAN